jgi:hypothetical protein
VNVGGHTVIETISVASSLGIMQQLKLFGSSLGNAAIEAVWF